MTDAPMTYVVLESRDEATILHGVMSTRAKAEAALADASIGHPYPEEFRIAEVPLDAIRQGTHASWGWK